MGVSVSVSFGILFITLTFSLVTVWDAYDAKEGMIQEARDGYVERQRELLDTSFDILNSTYTAPQNRITLNATNNGTALIDMRYTDIYLNGTHYNNTYKVFSRGRGEIKNTDVWGPEETAELILENVLAAPPFRIKISAHNSVSKYTLVT